MLKTKTTKTPLMMTEALGLSCYTSVLVPESKLSHCSEAHHGFILKLSHHGGKNSKNREQSQARLSYAEVHLVFAESKNHRPSDSKTENVQPEQYGRNNIQCFLVSVASGVFAFGDFKARSAAMVLMKNDENLFSIRHQQQQRNS